MPLPASAIISWLESLNWDARQEAGYPLLPGPFIPSGPDKAVIITPVPGPGFGADGAVDAGAFQARVRGPANDQAAAEEAAYALDALIFAARFPARVNGHSVQDVRRLGGTPALLAPGPDEGDRYELVTTYVVIAGN